MKKLGFLWLVLLVTACVEDEKAALTKQETENMVKEVVATWAAVSKPDVAVPIFQDSYLRLDRVLMQHQHADPELIGFAKVTRELFKSAYDMGKQNEWSTENILNKTVYAVNTFTGKGENLLDMNKELKAKQQQLSEQRNALEVQAQQLATQLCKKYQISCKVNTLMPTGYNKK